MVRNKLSAEVRAANRAARLKLIKEFCDTYGFNLKHINQDYQVRIHDVLDVYPTNGRWCLLSTQEWGNFDSIDDLKELFLDRAEKQVVDAPEAPDREPEYDPDELDAMQPLDVDDSESRVYVPSEPNDYFCIKQAFVGTNSSGEFPVLGLGSDDRIYKWVTGRWEEL